MKKFKKVISLGVAIIAVLIIGGSLLTTDKKVNATTNQQTSAINNEVIKVSRNYSHGDKSFTEFNNGSWYMINFKNNEYVFQAEELGDYDYICKDRQELNNLLLTYLIYKNEEVGQVKEPIKAVKSYYKGNKHFIEYNNGSWSLSDDKENKYIFQPAETGDYEYNCKDKKQLENITKTYISIHDKGYY